MVVLFVESFSLDSGKIDFPVQIATIRVVLSIICFEGSLVDFPNKCVLQSLNIALIIEGSLVDFPNKCVLQSLNIAFIIANSADPDEMQQTTKLPCQGFQVYKGFIPHYQRSSIK